MWHDGPSRDGDRLSDGERDGDRLSDGELIIDARVELVGGGAAGGDRHELGGDER